MPTLTYISHPNVVKDPNLAVPRWGLNALGFARGWERSIDSAGCAFH